VAVPDGDGSPVRDQRRDVLRSHRAEVLRQRAALDDALAMIDHKIDVYSTELTDAPEVDTRGVTTTPTIDGRGIRGGAGDSRSSTSSRPEPGTHIDPTGAP